MSTVLEREKVQSNQRPSYTRYELAKLIKDKRIKECKTKEQFARQYDISTDLLEDIENARRAFNVPMYKACSLILDKPVDQLTAVTVDENEHDYRANKLSEQVQDTVNIANMIFSEIALQCKLGVR